VISRDLANEEEEDLGSEYGLLVYIYLGEKPNSLWGGALLDQETK
jgi:hypothetical protein